MNYLSDLFNIENKVAVVTGGGGVLAGEMARGFLKAGAKVVILDHKQSNIDRKMAEINWKGGGICGYECDVLDKHRIEEIRRTIVGSFGRIDVLVNGAGGNKPGATIPLGRTVFDLDIDNLESVTDLNINGTVIPTLIFGKTMAEQKSGSIINISSMASNRVISRVVGYSAAKAAIDNFTRWMAVEMAQKFGDGIRVNAIAPGFLLSKQNKDLLTNPDGSLTDRGKQIIAMTPFKRFGQPEELVGTVIWLASEASRFVTGTIIPIDGGFNVYSGV